MTRYSARTMTVGTLLVLGLLVSGAGTALAHDNGAGRNHTNGAISCMNEGLYVAAPAAYGGDDDRYVAWRPILARYDFDQGKWVAWDSKQWAWSETMAQNSPIARPANTWHDWDSGQTLEGHHFLFGQEGYYAVFNSVYWWQTASRAQTIDGFWSPEAQGGANYCYFAGFGDQRPY